jgi:hypothetical protein
MSERMLSIRGGDPAGASVLKLVPAISGDRVVGT